jgi:hypothetical protein
MNPEKLVSKILHQIELESEQEEHIKSEKGIYRASGVGVVLEHCSMQLWMVSNPQSLHLSFRCS